MFSYILLASFILLCSSSFQLFGFSVSAAYSSHGRASGVPTNIGPRGSAYRAPGNAHTAQVKPPILRSISPSHGAREGGATLTIRGAGFRRANTLSVRFAATWPRTELDIVPATYVDASTITCKAPSRETDHTAHVSVSNDGITYSSAPMKTFAGHGTYLWYATVSPRPTGHWRLWNSTFPAQGGGVLTAFLDGKFVDGKPDGSTFFSGGLLYCSFGATTRRTFTEFTTPQFFDSATALTQDVDLYNNFVAVGHQYGNKQGHQATNLPTPNTLNSDQALSVYPYVADDYDTYQTKNITYELVGNTSTHFRWRKFAAGMAPSGDFSDPLAYSATAWTELDLGVKVKFRTTSGKNLYDKWVFTAVSEVPYLSSAAFHSDREMSCKAPALDPSLGGDEFARDVDPYRVGHQHELKATARGLGAFSAVTYYDASDQRIVLGPTSSHADSGDWPHHSTNAIDTPRPGTLPAFSQDIKIVVEGYYTGAQEYTYDVAMVSSTEWVWTKYPARQRPSTGGPTTGARRALSTSAQELDSGVFIRWASTTGKTAGDRWTFTAYTFWSLSFSDVRPSAEADAHDIVVEGTFICDDSATYEVVTQGDSSTFKWRRWHYTGSAPAGEMGYGGNVAFTDNTPITLDCGLTVRFPTGASGRKVGDTWTFDAYSGHVVTYLSKDYISPAVGDVTNKVGDPRVPTTSGTYLGNATVTYTIEICNPDLLHGLPPCTTSCTNFRWMKNATEAGGASVWTDAGFVDGTWSEPIAITDAPMPIADGLYVQFGMTSGYQLGNKYYVTVKPLPSSIIPIMHAYPPAAIRPTPYRPWFTMDSEPQILVSGTYETKGDVPTHDNIVTIEFLTPSSFVYRRNTEAYIGPVTLTSDSIKEPMPLYGGIGTYGLNLTFTSYTGYKTGIKYLIPLKTHIPRVRSISTTSTTPYTLPVLTVPMADSGNYRNTNNGSLLGDLVSLPSNVGFTNVTMWTSAGMGRGDEHNFVTSETAGVSNFATTVHTPGYVYHTYPQIEIQIAGDAAVGPIRTQQAPTSLNVSDTYTGVSSYVYEIQVPATSSTVFQWRKWMKGFTTETATNWSPSLPIKVLSQGGELFDDGMYAAFELGSYSSGSNWVFTAERGHSFRYRVVGNPTWSPETEITGTSQSLAAGFSVRFGALSGYSSGDVFYSTNRTVDAYGIYSGMSDASYMMEIVGGVIVDAPIILRTTGYGVSQYSPPLSTTTGLAAQLSVTGTYEGRDTVTYELMISQAGSPSMFRWRKFFIGHRDGAGPFSGERIVTLSPTYIDDGLSVAWGAITGQSLGDVFTFTVHKGDAFRWRKSSLAYNPSSRMQQEGKYEGTFSRTYRMYGVGFVESDLNNQDADSLANDAIKAIGTYTGVKDYTYVVEILHGGTSFRWKYGPYDQAEGRTSPDSINTKAGAYEVVPIDSVVRDSVEGGKLPSVSTHDRPDEIGAWSGAVSMVAGFPLHLENGLFLLFNKASGFAHGDIYYIPCKATTHFELSDGVHIVWGSRGGYAKGDKWSFQARAAFPARGPMDGNTELTVKGSGFLPTDKLRCRLYDPKTQHNMVMPAYYDSDTQLRCITKAHPRDTISDPEFNGFGLSLLESGGVFTGGQTTTYIIEMISPSTFRWRAIQADSSAREKASAWSATMSIPTTYPQLATYPPPPPNYSGANRRRLLYDEYYSAPAPVYAREPAVTGGEIAQFQGVETSHLNFMTTHLGPFYVYGTETSGGLGYYWPIYLTRDSGRAADKNAKAHEHTFAEYPETTFYMPSSGTVHHAKARPPTNNTIVDFGYRGIVSPQPSTSAPFIPWTDLSNGVRIRFARSDGYTTGDMWRVHAYYLQSGDIGADSTPAVQLDSLKPGVVKHLYVSNDGGMTWSKDESGLTRFISSDLYVSVSGSDETGDGTYDRPFATIQRGINAALESPRTSYRHNDLEADNAYLGAPSNRGLDAYINRDRIILMPGRYTGVGNVDLVPRGRMIELISHEPNAAVIDCSGTQSGDIVYQGDMYQGGGVPNIGAVRFSLVNVESCDDHRVSLVYNAAAEGRSRDPFPTRPSPIKP
ncbi:IPT/TIG domain-containing protein [Pseudoscourfieldia marina]